MLLPPANPLPTRIFIIYLYSYYLCLLLAKPTSTTPTPPNPTPKYYAKEQETASSFPILPYTVYAAEGENRFRMATV